MLTEKHYFYLIAGIVLVGTIMAYIFGILGGNLILKAINLPKWFLVPFIATLLHRGVICDQKQHVRCHHHDRIRDHRLFI